MKEQRHCARKREDLRTQGVKRENVNVVGAPVKEKQGGLKLCSSKCEEKIVYSTVFERAVKITRDHH